MYFSIKFVLLLTWIVAISLPCRLEALDDIEIYLAGYGMATQPLNQGLSFKGNGTKDEKIHGDPGLGLKIGLFPSLFSGYLGLELESFGQNNSLNFPIEENGAATGKGKSGLITYSSMVNLLLRYPGRYMRPYVGIGGGLSNGILHHSDIPGRKDHYIETSSAPGYQFFGGIQLVVAANWFVFGEYKYSAANYHWNELSLNFRSEYFLGGIGYIF
ncbi:MAG: outer membrane beta-barrel protein [Nitrospirales bacterium]|nr:outer membrane beta-barrel protein [Nitrospirales bacterium]